MNGGWQNRVQSVATTGAPARLAEEETGYLRGANGASEDNGELAYYLLCSCRSSSAG